MLLRKQSQHNRLLILNLFIGLPLFLLNFYAIRFEYFNLLYTIIPFLCLIDDIYKKSNFHRQNKGHFPLSIYILILGYLILQITSSFPLLLQEMPPKTDYLNENLLKNIEKTKGTILTDIFLSPIYVYKCDVNTVSTPYHSNTEGIIDGHKILYSTNDFDIISLLLKHQITQIVLFENYDKSYYNMNEQNKHKLYYRILKDERLPPYLEKIPSNNENIHHYKVLSL